MPATADARGHAPGPGGPGACLAPVLPLATRRLGRRFGGVAALSGLDLQVAAGTVVGLLGPNGSGKTTALRLVAGLDEPDAGLATVGGHRAGTIAARRRLAFVPDEPGGFDELTAGELVALVGALHGRPEGFDRRADVLLDAFGLRGRRGDSLATLSRGLRRQVSFVAACAVGAPLLLVDEATATLDPEAVIVVREALRAVAERGGAVLLASQDLHFAETVCDEVWLLAHGATVASGPVAALLARAGASSLEAAFLSAVGRAGLADSVRESLAAL